MRLNRVEFSLINSPFFRLFQRFVEFPLFRRLGMDLAGKQVLEIGCGSGHGAALIAREAPASYTGVDLMKEQIRLAKARGLPGFRFEEGDVSDLSGFADESVDVVLDCRILHHVPEWKKALAEVRRVLSPGGDFFAMEPHPAFTGVSDRLLFLSHPAEACFSRREFSRELTALGFEVRSLLRATVFVARGIKK